VGIFGTTAYTVARRTQEVGIRMALGARPGQMIGAIVRDAAWPVALGIAIGLGGAVGATRVIASFLFDTEPTDRLTFATATMALAATALVAAWIPARRACTRLPHCVRNSAAFHFDEIENAPWPALRASMFRDVDVVQVGRDLQVVAGQ
jgi:hypothetical protein